MAAIAGDMPDGTRGPEVDIGDVAIASIAVTGDGLSPPELEDAAEALRDRLHALGAVSAVALHGVQEERIVLGIDRRRLAAVGDVLGPLRPRWRGRTCARPPGP